MRLENFKRILLLAVVIIPRTALLHQRQP
jgi:hypothetical protein